MSNTSSRTPPTRQVDAYGEATHVTTEGNGRTALICGISGQDGTYLAELLLKRGYKVVGTSRDAASANTAGLRALGIEDSVSVVSMALDDFRSVLKTIARHEPDEIYNLAGQTSVGLSFEQPVEAIESISIGTLNILEAIRFVDKSIRFYSAGSSECFGDTGGVAATEATRFDPRSPYAVAKACAHNLVANYRDAYGLHASTGILFNHESPLRSERFVTQKVVRGAAGIAAGLAERVTLGNLDIHRDWGWAPDYVLAMWMMLQQEQPQDYVIATGHTVSLAYFVERAFSHFGLDWQQHVGQDSSLLRPSDIKYGAADPSKALVQLGWAPALNIEQIVNRMCVAAASRLERSR